MVKKCVTKCGFTDFNLTLEMWISGKPKSNWQLTVPKFNKNKNGLSRFFRFTSKFLSESNPWFLIPLVNSSWAEKLLNRTVCAKLVQKLFSRNWSPISPPQTGSLFVQLILKWNDFNKEFSPVNRLKGKMEKCFTRCARVTLMHTWKRRKHYSLRDSLCDTISVTQLN